MNLGTVDVLHDPAALAREETLAFEQEQPLTDRRTADTQRLAKLVLDKPLPRLELGGQDYTAQPGISVRDTAQAIGRARTTAMATVAAASWSVFQ
jgi:hypothetical protein